MFKVRSLRASTSLLASVLLHLFSAETSLPLAASTCTWLVPFILFNSLDSHKSSLVFAWLWSIMVKCMVTNSVEIEIRGSVSCREHRYKRGRGAAGPRKI